MNAKTAKPNDEVNPNNAADEASQTCGIIMPIAAMGEYPESHWRDVKKIIDTAVFQAGFKPNLVSASTHVGVILKRIVNNIYDNPVVVCDVSGKNPNVMFELGLRLAFDKPVVIIKDDDTSYSFDTSVIEHINYRRDLRIHETNYFIEELAEKIRETHKASESDKHFSPFLKQFGEFEIKKIQHRSGSFEDVMLSEMAKMRVGLEEISIAQRNYDKHLVDVEHLLPNRYNQGQSNYKILSSYENKGVDRLRSTVRSIIRLNPSYDRNDVIDAMKQRMGDELANYTTQQIVVTIEEELKQANRFPNRKSE